MTSPWPSDTPRTTRASRMPKAKSVVPTDWVSGWAVMFMVVAVAGAVGVFVLWPLAAQAMDGIQVLSDTLERSVRNFLA